MLDDFAVLILSCDRFKDVWPPYFKALKAFWPQCPYPVYLGANETAFDEPGVTTLLSGEDRNWSDSCAAILSQVKENYIWLGLDDFFVVTPVDQDRLERAVAFMQRTGAKHVHLVPRPRPDRWDGEIGTYDRGRPYRVNLYGLWDRRYLLKLLLPGETPWNFEIMGSYRTAYEDGFHCLRKPPFDTLNMIEKGKWIPGRLEKFKKLGVAEIESGREIFEGKGEFTRNTKVWLFNAIDTIPWRLRLKTMNLLRKLFVSY